MTSHWAEVAWSDEPLKASAEEVHVWRLPLDGPAPDWLERVLDPTERKRAEHFQFARDRDRHVIAHGLLRHVLGRYAGIPAGAIAYRVGLRGKPCLAVTPGRPPLRFNLSHSADLALCAVTLRRELGVDVEQVRGDRDHQGIAERFFSPAEFTGLRALPPAQRQDAFYACWTRKEAYAKARGEGLSLALDSFDVSVAPAAPAAVLRSEAGPAETTRWRLEELRPAPGYVAALAVEGRGWALRTFTLAPGDGEDLHTPESLSR